MSDEKIEMSRWLTPKYYVVAGFKPEGRKYFVDSTDLIGEELSEDEIENIEGLAKIIHSTFCRQRKIVCDLDPTKKWDDLSYEINGRETEPASIQYNLNGLDFVRGGPLTGQEWSKLFSALYNKEKETRRVWKEYYSRPGPLE